MSKKVKTAIIPAAGYGTRFLPSTKSIPKEMFPLGNKPIILHVVEEAVTSGIERIIFVVSHHKHAVENFFTPDEMQEDYLMKLGKTEEVEQLKKISNLAEFSFVFAKPPMGNGGALLSARSFVEEEPFVVLWADEIIISHQKPRLLQCIEAFEKYGKPVISGVEIKDPKKRSRYGMAELKDLEVESEVKEILKIVEKPALGQEPSTFATHGAYVLPPEIFSYMDQIPLKNRELWLTDAINELKKETGLLTKIIPDALYLDCGNPLLYLESQIEYAIRCTDDKDHVKKLIHEKANI